MHPPAHRGNGFLSISVRFAPLQATACADLFARARDKNRSGTAFYASVAFGSGVFSFFERRIRICGVCFMFDLIREDIASVKARDPAVRSSIEVFFLYPGLRAIRSHRQAKWFYKRKMFFAARWISQRSARKTGIEIHPGAKIGRRFFIDHGTGVVIGETAVIGDDVTVYQGVTLGGTGKDTGKRHPTIGNNVLIGAGAKILGPFKVGDNSNIAAGAVVLEEIPPNSTAVGVPARVVKRNGKRVEELDQIHIPDPVAQEICHLKIRLEKLENHITKES